MSSFQDFKSIINFSQTIASANEDLQEGMTIVDYITDRYNFKPETNVGELYQKFYNEWMDGVEDAFLFGVLRSQYIAFHLMPYVVKN